MLMRGGSCLAQSATYKHDATKMNQFTMQETGAGSFQPESEFLLYDVFHNSYKKTITSTNKSLYRTASYEATYNQVEMADSIRKRLEDRAKEEALNIADRQLDLAWLTEQSKIENALMKYKNNVNMLSAYGATSEEKEDWEHYGKMYDFAIERTKNAYMANSLRQKEYLTIYNDITKRNTQLIKRMRYLKALGKCNNLLNAHSPIQRRVAECATASYNNWRGNLWNINQR